MVHIKPERLFFAYTEGMSLLKRRAVLVLPLLLTLGGASLAAPSGKKTAPAPLNMSAAAQMPVITLPDPKYPGKPLIEVHAKTVDGVGGASLLGNLSGVWARLYQHGTGSAVLTAPRVVGSSVQKTVVVTATGGVVVKSLTQPGTKLTADKVVWYPNARTDQILATGHVVYHDGKSGAIGTGPWLKADTQMKSFRMGAGHATGIF